MNNNDGLKETNFSFPKQKKIYKGKVRDIYQINGLLLMIVTDRISAFDIVLPQPIPYKGQVLNQIAEYFLDTTSDILPNWKIICPHPMCMLGHKAKPFGIEMVIRGYLSGHASVSYTHLDVYKRQVPLVLPGFGEPGRGVFPLRFGRF